MKNIGELCTLEGPARPRVRSEMDDIGVRRGAAVAVDGARIAAVGPESDILARYRAPETHVLDAEGRCVVPGLVDPHTHLAFVGSREFELPLKLRGKSYLEILEAGGGIRFTTSKTRGSSVGGLVREMMPRLDRMLLYGTTTAEAKSGYGLSAEAEARSLEAIAEAGRSHPIDLVPTFMGAHAVPDEFRGDPAAYVDDVIERQLPMVAEQKLARYCDAFCEVGVFDLEDSRRILERAKGLGLGLKLHVDEIENLSGATLAASLGAVSVEHCVQTRPDEMDLLAEAGTVAVLLPATPYSLMSRDYAPARAFIDRGVPVALATDLNPNCYTESMPFVISLAVYMMGMTPAEALTASTVNAAYAIGEGGRTGSIEVGKQADLVILDAPNHLFLPYRFGINLVDTVVKAGEVVVRGGRRADAGGAP